MLFILDIKPLLNTQNNSIWAKLFAWHLLAECRKTPVYWFVTYKIFLSDYFWHDSYVKQSQNIFNILQMNSFFKKF